MINILITGSNGQLGQTFRKLSALFGQFTFTFADIEDIDLTDDQQVKHHFSQNHYKYIINCAAYTSVDQAEKEPEIAYRINSEVPERLGNLCMNQPSCLIHLSTDYIYNGSDSTPHLEEDIPLPASVYGQSKLEGEKALWQNPKAIVIRTSWLYSEYGKNFVKTMMRLFREKEEVGVVFDQVGNPTYAEDLARAILHIITYSEEVEFRPGIYNYSNEGVCSWFDLAHEIMTSTNSKCRVNPIRTKDFSSVAQRPEYSVMDKHKIRHTFALDIPHWRNSLIQAIKNMEV
jgi:dTDP-4-dehydrorhamnose reductase